MTNGQSKKLLINDESYQRKLNSSGNNIMYGACMCENINNESMKTIMANIESLERKEINISLYCEKYQ